MSNLQDEQAKRVTQSELARRVGVSRQAIHDLINRGLLQKGDDGLIDFEQAKRDIDNNLKKVDAKTLNNIIGNPPPSSLFDKPEQPNEYNAARLRDIEATAGMKELKLKEKEGSLIDKEGYERAAHTTARTLRDALINNLPARISQELAALTDPWQIECFLREQMRLELKTICSILEPE